ncbi:signal peptidase I [Tuberibacillus sp. Marseille-P3662]|uniref:signal peptidase I n=1 Tax=Tuberibacillus sp. Marseille-P3662 TaxID=1965358 RepID=UPI000A1CDE0E|nr:signal peptidase I [Tuberibacillus sp. Marseille-P3662]
MADFGKKTWGMIKPVIIAIILAALIRQFLFTHIMVDGRSMMPTLHDNDHLIVNRLETTFGDLERFDIVVFHATEESDYIKRVIGLPGETIQYKNGQLIVDGKKIEEPFLQKYKQKTNGPLTYDFKTKVPEGKVFVLGDNRRNSTDSRIIGSVDLDKIVGEANLLFWPVPHFEFFK